MNEIKNWEAIIMKNGQEVIAIPLPGCIIKGELDGKEVKLEAFDINLSNLTFITPEKVKYRLAGARADYLSALNQFIEMGKDKNISIPDIDIEYLGKDEGLER